MADLLPIFFKNIDVKKTGCLNFGGL